jgi:hypothetical protein
VNRAHNEQVARLAHFEQNAGQNSAEPARQYTGSLRDEHMPVHDDQNRTSGDTEVDFFDSDGEWDDGESLILDGRFCHIASPSDQEILSRNSDDVASRSEADGSSAQMPETNHFVRGGHLRATVHGNHGRSSAVLPQAFEERAIEVPASIAAATSRPEVPKKPEHLVRQRPDIATLSGKSSPVTSDGEKSPTVRQGIDFWERASLEQARSAQHSPEPLNRPLRQTFSSFSGSDDALNAAGNLLTRRMEAVNEEFSRRLHMIKGK